MKELNNAISLKERTKIALIVLGVAIVCNIGLAFVKLYVGLAVNSLMIMLDAINSFFDILTAIATAVAFSLLFLNINEKAPFGYGRSEYVAGFVVATVSVVLGGVFFMRSLNRLAMPEPLYFGVQYCILISVALAVKIGLAVMFALANKKYKSKALSALMLDSFLDIGITATSLVSFAVSAYVNYAVDAIFGIVVSIVIVIYGVLMIADNLKSVVVGDKCEEEKDALKSAFEQVEGVLSVEQIAVHDYGFAHKAAVVEIVPNSFDDIENLLDKCNETALHLQEENGIQAQVVLAKHRVDDAPENK
ncbi:MAG: cation diffusion facilitator family transporter [Clostridia bacterium]|nr:cation diffusion facilitator family transporter [Clostridia bacterium]